MEIHKPKPWRGWREFLKEYLIIVVGVLTALGAEQLAEALHTRHVIHEAEAAMRSELLDDDLPQAWVRMAVTPCLTRDLNRLKAAVDDRMAPEGFGVLAQAYIPPLRTWDHDAWSAAGASGAAARMDGARLLEWSNAYVQIPFLQATAAKESDAVFTHLYRSRYRSGTWTAQSADELSDTIDELQALNFRMAGDSGELIVKSKASGVQLTRAAEQRLTAAARKAYGDCVAEPNLRVLAPLQGHVTSPAEWEQMRSALGGAEP
jgi:hypothetical protein